ncbi:HAD family hydrolase [Actinacidiphila alni]|uniref:HAD family hydrolase n=1 Tax=Actinacidiphila alni TaxID=380248 RepID=UPI0015A6AC3E|nr:HAD-IA family hydrolase [Actinacidiphila alni]
MTSAYTGPPGAELDLLLSRAECFLFDFDGPLCDLFLRHPAAGIAELMHAYLAERDMAPRDPEVAASDNPARILRAVRDPRIASGLEALLSAQEKLAAASAEPTTDAEFVVKELYGRGKRLAITTNNSPGAVHSYLDLTSLHDFFDEEHVFGRDPSDPQLMKPDPSCLLRAVTKLDVRPADCLMIGDSPMDAEAAAAAGIPFLGFAYDRERMLALRRESPGSHVIVTWQPVRDVFETAAPEGRAARTAEG